MDAFIHTMRERAIPNDMLTDIVDGLAESQRWRRIPTTRVLDQTILGCTQPMLRLFQHITQSNENATDASCALSLGLGLTHRLLHMQIEARRDRLAMPLELLAMHNLRDRDFLNVMAYTTDQSTDPRKYEDCSNAIQSLARHAGRQLAQGQPFLRSLPGPAMRCLAALAGAHASALCRLLDSGSQAVNSLALLTGPDAIDRFLSQRRFRAWRLALVGRIDPRLARLAVGKAS
jgi:phytoene/squalene synthetase